MTYLTADPNTQPSVQVQGGTTGRVTKEDDSQINFANWICDVSTPGSGVNLNIDASSMSVVVEQDEGNVLQRMQDGKILFVSEFQQGLDTLNKFHLVYNGTAQVPGIVNASASGLDGEVFEADFSEGYIETEIDYSGAADTNQWVIQSQTPMKFSNSGTAFSVFNSRVISAGGFLGNVFGSLVSRKNGVDTVIQQIEWNINTFLSGTPEPTNPAGINFFSNRLNSFVFQYPYKDAGDVKFGFIIDNKIVYAHEFTKQNALQENVSLVDKPLRIEGGKITGLGGVVRFGNFDHDSGYFFQLSSNVLIGPNLLSRFYSASCYAYGALDNDFHRTFSKGNETTVIPVTTRRPLVSMKPKQLFPPATPNVDNATLVSIKEIKVAGNSLDLNEGIFIEVIFNQGPTILTGATFSITDVDSSVDIDTAANLIGVGGKQIYAAPVYPNQGNVSMSIKSEDLFTNFMNQYTCSHIVADGGVDTSIDPTISVVATSISGNSVSLTATIVWGEKA